jgi:MYXO-CTERM domain-containing protein
MKTATLTALATLVVSSAASAGLAFSFSDPVPGRQLTHVQANQAGAGTGVMSYDQFAALAFYVDGSGQANPFDHIFSNARMEMSMTIYTGSTVGGVFSAPVTGFFRIFDATTGADIVRGDATGGAFLRVAGTSSLLLSSDAGFSYTFGAALQSLLASSGNAGVGPIDPQEAVFTITDALAADGGSIIGSNGVIQSFSANSSYSGNVATTAVPAPGAAALIGLAGLATRRRRA